MTNPSVGTITDLFLPNRTLNPQWNTNSGNFGVDPILGIPFIEATSSPSYVGASLYTAEYSSFFCNIVPASPGNGTIQTAIIIRSDSYNYAEMSVGPSGVFNAYVSDNRETILPSTPMPVYNPTAHAYWRIRNDDKILFHFDTSPDGATWTELCNIPYSWDASTVTVMLFAGFTGIENQGNHAYVTHINTPPGLLLSGSALNVFSIRGHAGVIPPVLLSGRSVGNISVKASSVSVQNLPEGGLTDFSYAYPSGSIDPLMIQCIKDTADVGSGLGATGSTITMADWIHIYSPYLITQYRDNSYWPAPKYMSLDVNMSNIPDNNYQLTTNAKIEQTTGLQNRLSLDAYIYDTACCYGPGQGITSVTRVTSPVLTGQYSGKIVGNGSNVLLASSNYAYYPMPESSAIVPVKILGVSLESLEASVSLNTTRANTQWFAALIYFDSSFNILSSSTINNSTITNMNTHPGGGVWQTGSVYKSTVFVSAGAYYVAVVPVIVTPSSSTQETVYMSNHFIQGVNPWISDLPSLYTHPRTANINVKANAVNYCLNSGFNTNTTLWYQTNVYSTGSPTPVTVSWDGTTGFNSLGSMKVSYVAPSGTFGGSNGLLGTASSVNFAGGNTYPPVQGLIVGKTYNVSAWIKQSINCPDVFMNFYDSNFTGIQNVSVNTTKIDNPDSIDGTWTRISFPYTIPPLGLPDYAMFFYVKYSDYINATKPFSFWVDSIMVTESSTPIDYFDGSFPLLDYMWESSGTPNLSRSYYYKDYVNKNYRLTKALPSVLPIGEYFNLQYALPPDS